MKTFIWASAHKPTEVQLEELNNMGKLVFMEDLNPELFKRMCNCPSTRVELVKLAEDVHRVAEGSTLVQPAGSPVFMTVLGSIVGGVLHDDSMIFAHSERVSIDEPQPDGSVRKVSIFKHLGWV